MHLVCQRVHSCLLLSTHVHPSAAVAAADYDHNAVLAMCVESVGHGAAAVAHPAVGTSVASGAVAAGSGSASVTSAAGVRAAADMCLQGECNAALLSLLYLFYVNMRFSQIPVLLDSHEQFELQDGSVIPRFISAMGVNRHTVRPPFSPLHE